MNQHQTRRRGAMAPIALAVVLFACIFTWGASWAGLDRGSAVLDAVYVLVIALPWVTLWLAAAGGLGVTARYLLRRIMPLDGVLQFSVGIALLLILDAALGSMEVLQFGGTSGPTWVLTIAAIIPLAITFARNHRQRLRLRIAAPWMYIAIAPAAAVLILAACSAPGWLWASEFGGYDVLSYHLQLPREWFNAGQIVPFDHNVYSFLPGSMEAAYYHLMVLRGDPHEAIYACQLLHASLAIVAAAACARVSRCMLASAGYDETNVVTAAFVLGTPWIVVVGSMAYNELPTVLTLAAGLSVIVERRGTATGRAIGLGILMAAAVSAKPTAIGFVALPLVLVSMWMQPKRLTTLATIAGVSIIALLPWLIRNMMHGGNPFFPFLTDIFGSAHYTEQQVTTWNAGHQPDLSITERVREGFTQLFRYGLGVNPDPTGREPWQPQWSILPWLALAGAALGTTASKLRRPALLVLLIMAVQFVFWILVTHIKSRFMAPMVVPATIGTTIGLLRILQLLRLSPDACWYVGRVIVIVIALAYCAQPVLLYRAQQDGAPSARIGWVGLLTGEELTPEERASVGEVVPSVKINYGLPGDARILLVGDAAPLYYTADVTYTTTWDRGPMSTVIDEHPDDRAAWMNAFSDRGYTHLLLQPGMLELWQESGWADPALDPQQLMEAAEQHATLITRFPDGASLYRLP